MKKEGYGIPNVSHLVSIVRWNERDQLYICISPSWWHVVIYHIPWFSLGFHVYQNAWSPCLIGCPTFSGAGVGGREGASGPTSRLAFFFGCEQLKRVAGFPVLKQGKHQINHLYKPMIIFLYVFIHKTNKNHLSFETEIFFLFKEAEYLCQNTTIWRPGEKEIILAIPDGRMLGFHHISPEDTTFHVIDVMLVRILIKQGFSMVKFFEWLRDFARLSTYIQTAKHFISIELPAVWRYLHTSKMSHSTHTENGCLEDESEIKTCSYESLQILARKV